MGQNDVVEVSDDVAVDVGPETCPGFIFRKAQMLLQRLRNFFELCVCVENVIIETLVGHLHYRWFLDLGALFCFIYVL